MIDGRNKSATCARKVLDYFFLIGELKKQFLDLLGAFRLSATGRSERVFPDDKRPGDFAGIKRNKYFCRVQLLTFLLS